MSVQFALDGYIGRQHAGGLYVLGKGDRYIIAVTQNPVSRRRRTDRLGTDHILDDGEGLGLLANLLFSCRFADGHGAYLIGAVGVVFVGHWYIEAEVLSLRHRVVTFAVTNGDTLAPCAERTPFAFAAFILQADAIEGTVVLQQTADLTGQFDGVLAQDGLGLRIEQGVVERQIDIRAGVAVADGEVQLRTACRVAVAIEFECDIVVLHHFGVGLIDAELHEERISGSHHVGDTCRCKRRAVHFEHST